MASFPNFKIQWKTRHCMVDGNLDIFKHGNSGPDQ